MKHQTFSLLRQQMWFLCLLCLITCSNSFIGFDHFNTISYKTKFFNQFSSTSSPTALLPPTREDMKQFGYILANVTDNIDSSPEIALSITSKNMGWLYTRNIPK